MAEIRRVRAVWTGAGSPYLSTWYFQNDLGSASAAVTNVRAFLTTLAPRFVTGLRVDLEADQSIIDDQTGTLQSIETGVPGASIVGTNGGEPLPFQTQGVMRLTTDGIVAGRRVRGRFYVPGPSEADSNPVPLASYLTVLNNAGANLITATAAGGAWAVWSRPVVNSPTVPNRPGSSHPIKGSSGWSKWGIQRRRRD